MFFDRVMITGDCHGAYTRFEKIENDYGNEDIAMICLGDFGINFYLNKSDQKMKKWLSEKYPNITFYLVRGNHEQRPQLVSGMEEMYDDRVDGPIYWEPQYPNIRYFMDYGYYTINGWKCAVIGGAYSVDKWYRLARGGFTEETNIPKKTGWFPDEQLTKAEMDHCEMKLVGRKFDFVFTHTCPLQYQPTDLFLGFVEQSKVDNRMEVWMDELFGKFDWTILCFGHYHSDRIERPYVEQYFNDIEDLQIVWNRWDNYSLTGELDWWLNKSPNFYMGR